MISVLSFLFEGVVAALMVALIVYCIRLDRRLAVLRQNDAPIRALIAELQSAADRADAAVGHLKAAGLDAERSLQQAIRTAQAVEDDLVRRGRIAAAVPSAVAATAAPPPKPAAVAHAAAAPAAPAREVRPPAVARAPAAKPPAPKPPATRTEAERDLLRAIRFARAEGEA